MDIEWNAFTPGAARIGGALIGVATIEMKTTFMRPAEGELRALGTLLHRTTTMAFTEGRVLDGEGRIAVPGIREMVTPLTDAEIANMKKIPYEEKLFREQVGMVTGAKLLPEGPNPIAQLWRFPSLTVTAIQASSRKQPANIINDAAWARVTVRTNLTRFVGGAKEETIIARVGEGIVTTIGAAETYKVVLENPDSISKTVLARGLAHREAHRLADATKERNEGALLGCRLAQGGHRARSFTCPALPRRSNRPTSAGWRATIRRAAAARYELSRLTACWYLIAMMASSMHHRHVVAAPMETTTSSAAHRSQVPNRASNGALTRPSSA